MSTVETTPERLQQAINDVYATALRVVREMDYRHSFRLFFRDLEKAHGEFFQRAVTPMGEPWKPLSPRRIREKGHASILVDTTKLRESLIAGGPGAIRHVEDKRARFGTSVPYSVFHQKGVGRLPKRQHVGLNGPLCDRLADLVATAIGGALLTEV